MVYEQQQKALNNGETLVYQWYSSIGKLTKDRCSVFFKYFLSISRIGTIQSTSKTLMMNKKKDQELKPDDKIIR